MGAYYRLDGGFEALALEMLTGKPAISALPDWMVVRELFWQISMGAHDLTTYQIIGYYEP